MKQEEILKAIEDVNFGKCLAKYVQLTKNGDAVQMVYRKVLWNYCDGDSKEIFEYLSYANIWMGSGLNRLSEDVISNMLIKVK